MAGSREEKRERVLKAARELIERFGFRKLTLEDVAQESGLAISSLYYYFKSKSDLLRAVAESEIAETLADIEKAAAAVPDPAERLNVVGLTLLRRMRKISRIPGISHSERITMFPELEPEIRKFKERFRNIIRSVIEEGNSQGVFEVDEPELLSHLISAGIRGLAETILDDDFPEEVLKGMERLSCLMVLGLKKRSENNGRS
ncbi:MAG TPA: TetR/AcrR family transcriptional regulator [Myxococcota bacterium]|nr:TetR/AcrR family transcriptional regulator [Myxococcota bacterium]